jgi:hypothetical protein
MGKKSPVLRHIPGPPPQQHGLELAGSATADKYVSGVRINQPIKAAKQRRLSRATFANQNDTLASEHGD